MASSVLRKLEKKNTSELKNETVICAARKTIEILSSLSSISFRCPPPKILYWENLRPWSCQIYIAPKNGSWHSHTPPLNNTLDLLRICWLPSIFIPMFLWTCARCSRKRRRFMGFRQGPHWFRALTSEWLPLVGMGWLDDSWCMMEQTQMRYAAVKAGHAEYRRGTQWTVLRYWRKGNFALRHQ